MTQDTYDRFKVWLGVEGIKFFTELYEEYGHLVVVLDEEGIPHPVHWREGMQVRNWMRSNTSCVGLNLDDDWERFVLTALELSK